MIDTNRIEADSADWIQFSERFDRFDGDKAGIAYKDGYKYQLARDYSLVIPIVPERGIHSDFIVLSRVGCLTIHKGYAWDGPSGPGIDTRNFLRGSLVHDALYQLIRAHGLDPLYRDDADTLMRSICRQDGMSAIRAWWCYAAVRFGGGAAADQDNPVLHAP